MMQRLLVWFSRRMQRLLETILVVLFAVLVFDVLLGVISRRGLGAQVEWTEELARYLLIWIGIAGAAMAFARNQHLGLDVLVMFFPVSSRRKAAIVSDAVCLFFTSAVFLYGGTMLTVRAFEIGRISPALQLPDGYIFLVLPVAGTFMAIFQFEALFQTLYGNPNSTDVPEHVPAPTQGELE
jgi:TRAP-type C4-dicarboxylate transport system permease small subunit